MKRFICEVLLAAAACNAFAYSQADDAKFQSQVSVEHAMAAQPLVLAGKQIFQMESLGDSVAAPIRKALGENQSPMANQIRNALTLVRIAFSHPERIKSAADKTPTQTVDLLNALSGGTPKADLRAEIDAVKQSVQPQPSK